MAAFKFLLIVLIISYNIGRIRNDQNSIVIIQQVDHQENDTMLHHYQHCAQKDEGGGDGGSSHQHGSDWLMDYYLNFQRFKKSDSYNLKPCSSLSYFVATARIPPKYSIRQWSSANIELIQAIAKVVILVILKIIIKYYVCDYFRAKNDNKVINGMIDLLSKATTIAIAKMAIKWSLYSALRTAMKTMLITALKILLKPWTKLIKPEKNDSSTTMDWLIRLMMTIQIKTFIKTIALHLLWLMFENNHLDQSLPDLIFRVSVIITVKMLAKRLCKTLKRKKSDKINNPGQHQQQSSPQVDEILSFALKKLVTKLVKIPLIKILFQ